MYSLASTLCVPVSPDSLAQSYPSDFPDEFDLKEIDPLSGESYEKSFKKAQDAHIPWYSIAVIDYGTGKKGVRNFAIYDSLYLTVSLKSEDSSNASIKKEKIKKIHYFFLHCFHLNEGTTLTPVSLEDKDVRFKQLEEIDADLLSLFIHSLNYHLFDIIPEESTNEKKRMQSQETVRRTEYIVFQKIKEGLVLSHLTPEGKLDEMKMWLWCSAHQSLAYRPTLELLELYNDNPQIVEQLLSQVKFPKIPLIAVERLAHNQLLQKRYEQAQADSELIP